MNRRQSQPQERSVFSRFNPPQTLGRFHHRPVNSPVQVPSSPSPNTPISSTSSNSRTSLVTPGRRPAQPTSSTATNSPSNILDLRASRQTNLATNRIRRFQGVRNMEAEENEVVFLPDGNTFFFHYYQPQRPTHRLLPPPAPHQIQLSAPVSTSRTFPGLDTTVREGSFSVRITNRLEHNYYLFRMALVNDDGVLTTPLRYLTDICRRLKIKMHWETFIFLIDGGDTQYRTEIYVGGFCGVAHANSHGFAKQLAAAHCLERMRIRFSNLERYSYALYPGSAFTRIGGKLKELCLANNLGLFRDEVRDRQSGSNGGRGRSHGGNSRGRVSEEAEWVCSCIVKDWTETVLSDSQYYGGCKAKAQMYGKIVRELEVPVTQMSDYYAIGADCPKFNEIHAKVLLYEPSAQKREWMTEYGIPDIRMDEVLRDPTNMSGYLSFLGDEVASFGDALNKVLNEIRDENINFGGPRRRGWERSRNAMGGPRNATGGPTNATGGRDVGAMEVGDGGMNGDMVGDEIFYDALNDVEWMVDM